MKKLSLSLLSLIIAIYLTACVSDIPKTETRAVPPIKIGFMTDLSGPQSAYGLAIQRGAQLALNEINQKSNNFKINVIFEDDKCSGSEGVTIANKLINIDKIKITGGTVCSSVALSIAPIMELNKIIHLSTGASSSELSKAGDYIFRVWPSDDFEAMVLADYISNQLNLKSVGILYVNSEFAKPLKDAFSKRFEENGGKILNSERYNTNEKDFKLQISKLAINNPEAIYLITNPPEIPIILKQIKELGIASVITSFGPPVQAEGVISAAGSNINELYYAHPDQRDSEWFQQQYNNFYNTQPGLGASVGYDTIMLLYKSITECGSDDSICVKNHLYSIKNYDGASGKISFDENGDVFIPSIIKKIENGKPVVIQ